ncbi:MAG: hypothetical protein ABSD78_07255 [Acidimicrobiales bacterium]|jgi:hypothetical protein
MSIDAPPQDTAPAEIATKSSAPVNTTLLVLIFSYGAVLFAFVPATVRALSQAWSAVSDDAVIAIRTSDALTWAGPLLGQHTLVTSAHSVFDPGPLQYWLLAIPVRIDPQHGALWGAALWCIVAGLITVEATRRAAGPFGAAIAALLVVWSVAWVPVIALNPVWNPYMGDLFFFAAVACSFAAICGVPRVWPLAVFAGSVAVQAHLTFLVPAIALVVVSGSIATAESFRTKKTSWWLAAGLGVGAACWAAPLAQEMSGHPGNLTLLFNSLNGQHRVGFAFGLRALSSSTAPHPVWLTPVQHLAIVEAIRGAPLDVGAGVLALTVAAALVGRWCRSRGLLGLVAVALCLEFGLVLSYSNIPVAKLQTIGYLLVLMLPVGFVVWLLAAWTAVLLVHRAAAGHEALKLKVSRTSASLVLATAAVGGLALASLIAQAQQVAYGTWMETPAAISGVQTASARIESLVRRGRVEVEVSASGAAPAYSYTTGVVWILKQAGWSPEEDAPIAAITGSAYEPERGVPVAHVTIAGTSVTVQILR